MSTDEFTTANDRDPVAGNDAWSRSGSAMIVPGDPQTRSDAGPSDITGGSARRTHNGFLIWSGPALAVAAFVFACAQAFGGLVAGPVASLIPGAADSPANHVRIIAVIYIGMSCAGAVLAWVALRRTADEPDAPRWAPYLANAAVIVCLLVAAQAVVLLMLSMLAPAGAQD